MFHSAAYYGDDIDLDMRYVAMSATSRKPPQFEASNGCSDNPTTCRTDTCDTNATCTGGCGTFSCTYTCSLRCYQ